VKINKVNQDNVTNLNSLRHQVIDICDRQSPIDTAKYFVAKGSKLCFRNPLYDAVSTGWGVRAFECINVIGVVLEAIIVF
jgi:hypothetical protein